MTQQAASIEPGWRKSSYSTSGNQCVEVMATPGEGVAVRDSKNPAAGTHSFTREGWRGFLNGLKAGRLT